MSRAYLIDPEAETITEFEYSGLESIYTALQCDTVYAATFNENRDSVFIDDEGLLKNPTRFFCIEGYPQPLAGRGLVCGLDGEGETVEPTVGLEWLKAHVCYVERIAVGGAKGLAISGPASAHTMQMIQRAFIG